MTDFPKPPFPIQHQPVPGTTERINPRPDHGEDSYKGFGRLHDKKALITGADSGIGCAVAVAFAREAADVAVAYLNEDEDAKETRRLVEAAGRRCLLLRGDISQAAHCRDLVRKAAETFGQIDIVVNNAAHQMSFSSIEEISDEEWQRNLRYEHFGHVLYRQSGAAAYEAGQRHHQHRIRQCGQSQPAIAALRHHQRRDPEFHSSTMPQEKVVHFGEQVPMKRPAQPRELAPVYVLLASDEASYVSGATVAVTGGKPII